MGRKRIKILNIGEDKLHFVDCKDDEGDMSRNYDMLWERYQDEQRDLDEKITALNARLAQSVETQRNAERWIALI